MRNDEARWAQIDVERFDRCVISPGRGAPTSRATSASRAPRSTRRELPVLGVCLGHQGLALAHGGIVGPAPAPMHGRRSSHPSRRLGALPRDPAGVPRRPLPLAGGARAAPRELEVDRPHALGHGDGAAPPPPPAVGRSVPPRVGRHRVGERLLRNFVARRHGRRPPAPRRRARRRAATRRGARALSSSTRTVRRPPSTPRPRSPACSASAQRVLARQRGRTRRFSFMGAGGALAARRRPRRGEHAGSRSSRARLRPLSARAPCPTRRRPPRSPAAGSAISATSCKAECGAAPAHRSPLPDAQLLFADRLVAYDHRDDEAHVVCLCEPATRAQGAEWADRPRAAAARAARRSPPPRPPHPGGAPLRARAARRSAYLDDIAACQAAPARGRELRDLPHQRAARPALRRRARRSTACCGASIPRRSPRSCGSAASSVISSSPERFLSLDRDGRARGQADQGHRRARRDPAARTAPPRRALRPAARTAPRT